MQFADVVVVGAGVNGAAIAYHLVRKGLRNVLVIDRAGIASGQTGASSAIVRQHYGHETTARMAMDSLGFFEHFQEETGGHAEFRKCGMVVVGGEADMPTMRVIVRMQQDLGIRGSMIDVQEIRELEPDLSGADIAGGCWEPDAGYADPVGTTAGLLRWATDHGATTWLHTTVSRLLREGEAIVGIETSRGIVATKCVVLAAGPWNVALAREAGTELPVRSSRHPVLIFKHRSGRRPRHILFDLVQVMYLRPDGSDLTLVGTLDVAHSGGDADPDNFAREPTFEEVSRWGELLLERFPAYTDVEALRGWCGIYEYTPDWHHIIDRLPTADGCFVISGTSGHGFKLAPAAGDIVSDLVLGRPSKYDVAEFTLDRFARGHSIRNVYSKTIIG
jgi:sarcosine oxidase subunit beta